MKAFCTLFLFLILSYSFAIAQDTLYIYKAGLVVVKQPVSDIDSVTFYKNYHIPELENVKDIEGNIYHAVTIGGQTWMTENLKVTKYRNGDNIGTTSSVYTDLTYAVSPKYQWAYGGIESNVPVYGRLYTWYAATDSRNIAPEGWHVATDAEWMVLQNYLIANGYNYDKTTTGNKIIKSISSKTGWTTSIYPGSAGYEPTKNNSTGLSFVPAGYRGVDGYYYLFGNGTDIWTSSENSSTLAYAKSFGYNVVDLSTFSLNKNYGSAVRCIKNVASLPVLTTTTPLAITDTTATCGGNITSDGYSVISVRGICWSKSPNPTLKDSVLSDSLSAGLFSFKIKGLSANTIYYARAYATNSMGTSYGNQVTFTTFQKGVIADIEGNVYHSVTIGGQTWMTENLKVTKYQNGDNIGTTSSIYTDLTYAVAPKYQWAYNGNESNVPVNGRLYTWHAVTDSRNIAPEGWHVASEAEWTVLQNYLIANGFNYDKTTTENKMAKSLCSTTGWNSSYTIGTPGFEPTQNNSTGFTMVPSGYRGFDGYYYNFGVAINIWTSSEKSSTLAYARVCGSSDVYVASYDSNKNYGNAVRCIKNVASSPFVTTSTPTAITYTTATCGGTITSDGYSAITARGICWSLSPEPTLNDSVMSDSISVSSFSFKLKGLTANTVYYARAYATNKIGTTYGNQVTFTTFQKGVIADIEGNVYHAVTIGGQTWMTDNLKVTKYRNGDIIGTTSSVYSDMTYAVTPKYQWAYNGIESNVPVYGRLYTWYAVTDSRNIAPEGWHVASDAEWAVLQNYLIANGYNYDKTTTENKIAKSLCSTTGWSSSTVVGTASYEPAQNNSSGFTMVASGYRGVDGYYYILGMGNDIWTSTENSTALACVRGCGYNVTALGSNNLNKNYGFAVRCIKDLITEPVQSNVLHQK